jgi:rhamnosyltransferase subunit B
LARILIHTLGSSGDVNPFFALGLTLRERGHVVHYALSPTFAEKARELGFSATVAGPDADYRSDLVRQMLAPSRDVTRPVRLLFERVLIPAIVPATEALEPLARNCDLFLSHTIQLAAPVVAARAGVLWASASPAAVCFPSGETDLPNVALRGLPRVLTRLSWAGAHFVFRDLDARANAEYARIGFPPQSNIALGGVYSRRLTLGLWSPSFFSRPADWPAWLQMGGYARWDAPSQFPTAPVWEHGPASSPRIVFTLGSSVVNDPRGYYQAALAAIAPTDWQAVLLGAPSDLPIPAALRPRVQILPYAPYADVFPHANAIVHQGGVGTTQAACYYGIPSLILPRGFDQWENAAHVQRQGWGLRLRPQDFSPTALRLRLERLLSDKAITSRVTQLGTEMRAEPGLTTAADLLEALLPTKV